MNTATLTSGERVRFARRVYWSAVQGCHVERTSMFDAHGGEHWVELPRTSSHTADRETRRRALEEIRRHVDAEDPGQVRLEETQA